MKKIKLFEEFVDEATTSMISGTSGRTITTLDNRKYEVKKDIKGAKIGSYINVLLPKGTIITNLPGGIFAHHEDLKAKYCTGYKGERWSDSYGVLITSLPETVFDIEKNSKILESLEEAVETAVNTFAKDETADGYDAKVFLGKFDGTTFKAQSTSKTWPDGVPVTKEFSRGGKKDVSLTGEFQLVDSDRGWWYIQGPKNTWYAVKHSDYGTPPFEY
jgi:hypothetical protein